MRSVPGLTRTPIMENGLELDAAQIAALSGYAATAVNDAPCQSHGVISQMRSSSASSRSAGDDFDTVTAFIGPEPTIQFQRG